MPPPNPPSGRRPSRPPGARPSGASPRPSSLSRHGSQRGAPRPPQQEGEEAPLRPMQDAPDPQAKKIIWIGAGAGVALVLLIVIVWTATRDDKPVEDKKGKQEEEAGERMPDHNTPEGKAALKKMFEHADPVKCRKFYNGINPDTAVKLKDILIPYLQRLDTGAGYNDAYSLATLLANAKDERVLEKVMDMGIKKKSAHDLLRPYGAMGADAVLARAVAEKGAPADTWASMVRECRLEECVAPLKKAAETCEVPEVAWICGDELYDRRVAIELSRVQAWLADASPRAQASGIKQMALQKDADRSGALMPFAVVTAASEARIAVLECAAKDPTLPRDLVREVLKTDETKDSETQLGYFEDCMEIVLKYKMRDLVADLKAISEAKPGTGIGRRAGGVAQQLDNVGKR